MAKFNLKQTGNTNIQTSFRYEVFFPTNVVGTNDEITGYNTSSQLPKANGEPITWHMPMGMKNFQAGKRTVEPVSLEFVIPSEGVGNAYQMFETWGENIYDLNTGVNTGKATYAIDGIQIRLIKENGVVAHRFTLLKAQSTTLDYGTVTSEGNELLKVNMTLIYDNYKYNAG